MTKTICEHPCGALCKASVERYHGEWTCVALSDTHFPNKTCPFYKEDPKKRDALQQIRKDTERIQNGNLSAWLEHVIGGMKK